MAFCSNCGKELLESDKFCSKCGTMVGSQNKDDDSRKTVYDGDLHKCPKCGEQLNAFVTSCPVCGYELRGTQKTSCVHELSLKLEKAETDKQKMEIISNFYIPNTKEDIYEFFILAYSNITAGGYAVDAWAVKLEQAYLKAKAAFGEGKEYSYIQELYEKISYAAPKGKGKLANGIKAIFLIMIGIAMMGIGSVLYYIYEDIFIIFPLFGIAVFVTGLVMFVLPNVKRKK